MCKQCVKRAFFLILIGTLFLTGCGENSGKRTKVVFTTGFDKDEVFRIDKDSGMLSEVMVYLTNSQNQYENVFGNKIWSQKIEGVDLEARVKETVLARIAQVKAMKLLSDLHGVVLTEQEQLLCQTAANQYYTSLNQIEIDKMKVTPEVIQGMYQDYALANKVYLYLIKDINPEISDDEARTITVQQIYITNYALNGKGEKVPLSDAEQKEAEAKAHSVAKMANDGTVFEHLMQKYSDDTVGTYSFRKGAVGGAFEIAAFNLGNQEISDVVETENGYHIIKCISTFNREETDANKIKIVEERKKEVFNQEYDEFLAGLTKNLNQSLWEEVTFIQDKEVTTKNFFEIYETVFH